jgi:hypothetical protein
VIEGPSGVQPEVKLLSAMTLARLTNKHASGNALADHVSDTIGLVRDAVGTVSKTPTT